MKSFSLRVTPLFFVTAALIGFFLSYSLLGTLLWIVMIFLSVLIHEMGHASMALLFRQKVRVEFTAFGGITLPSGPKLSLGKEFIVVLMGPLFGFLLFVLATFVADIPIVNPFLRGFVQNFRFVTLFWTVVNLLPILPLDGGQLLRIVLETFLGFRARKVTLFISVLFSTVLSVIFFLLGLGWFLLGVIFLLFAFQGIETLRRLKNYCEADEEESNREALQQAEAFLQTSQQEEARICLEQLTRRIPKGIICTIAKQYLAKIYFDRHLFQKAYQELLPIEKDVTAEGKCILYLSSFSVGDYKKVIALSGDCFQERRTVEVALYAAFSHAMLSDVKRALEWLKVVSSFEGVNLHETMENSAFDSIRGDKAFQEFLALHSVQ